MSRLLLLVFTACFSVFCLAKSPIYIGLDADMTAVAKEGGEAIRRGALIAIEDINKQGGVLGRPLELVVKDHRGNPARGIANMEQFALLDDLVAVLGGVHTPVALKELATVHQHQLIFLNAWAAGTPIIDNEHTPNYAFRVSVRDEQAGQVLVGHAKQRGAKKIGLLLERTGWGRSNERSMLAAAEQDGLTVTDIQWFNWGQKDMSAAVASLVEAGAEAILLVANAPEGVAIAEAVLANEHAAKLPIISHWGIAAGAFVSQVGIANLKKLDIAVLQTYSFAQPYDEARNQHVLMRYRERFHASATNTSIPSAVGVAHAYDLVHLLALAIQQAESTERSKVRDALENIAEYKGLVKHYRPPFTPERHDALLADDYIMATYNSRGHLIPVGE